MQLTIDSSQPLDDVLRVIGAMYNVRLTTDGTRRVTSADEVPERKKETIAVSSRRRGSAKLRRDVASTADVRAWALANGYEVGSKGRISDSVVAAFKAARRQRDTLR